jgi:hypothetical protein
LRLTPKPDALAPDLGDRVARRAAAAKAEILKVGSRKAEHQGGQEQGEDEDAGFGLGQAAEKIEHQASGEAKESGALGPPVRVDKAAPAPLTATLIARERTWHGASSSRATGR